jgi:hypothetical protein
MHCVWLSIRQEAFAYLIIKTISASHDSRQVFTLATVQWHIVMDGAGCAKHKGPRAGGPLGTE